MSCFYVLEINTLSVVSFAIIFSHSECCLFTLVILSFAMQKLLCLIRSHLFFIFNFISLGNGSKKTLIFVFYKLPSLTFRSLIHSEFIFVYGVRKCSNFVLLHVQFSQCHLLKRLFLRCIFLLPLSIVDCVSLFLGFLSCSIDLYFWFCDSTILF